MRVELLMALGAVLAAGCGGGDTTARAKVGGTVFYRGSPLAGGTIVFTPDPERGGRGPQATGEIRGDGTFTLRTEDEGGAIPGWHKVSVASPSNLPRKYADPDRSGQAYEVKAGRDNSIDLHLD